MNNTNQVDANSKVEQQKSKDYIAETPKLKTQADKLLSMVKKYVANSKEMMSKLQESRAQMRAQREEQRKQAELAQKEAERKMKEAEAKKQQEQAKATKPEGRPQRVEGVSRSASQGSQQANGYKSQKQGFSSANKTEANGNRNGNIRTRHFDGAEKSYGPKPNANGPRFGRTTEGQRPQTGRPAPAGTGAQRPSVAPKAEGIVTGKVNTKQNSSKKKADHGFEEKKSMNRKALMMKGFVVDESLVNDDGVSMGSKKFKGKKAKQTETVVAPKIEHAVITTDNLTVKMLAEKIGKPVVEIIKQFMILGNMVNINSNIDFESAELIAGELGVTLEKKVEKTYEEKLIDIKEEVDKEEDLVSRPPVVTVLGHVDHGKTSLLDYIRNTHVIAGEAGGITQHIGAYTIETAGQMITFIDTPGHAAFTAMRERGAKLTDIAILVVAADDGVMPQTIEAIKHIKQVDAPMIVAINKIDKPEANIDRIKQQLTENGVVPEEWGGDAILIPISAKTGQNIDKLIEMILFVAEYQNLKANPNKKAVGSVIEARLDKGKGPVATILIQNGTLKVGDFIIAGTSAGKVRAMFNEKGKNVKSAGPSFAVSVLGLSSTPNAGDEMYSVDEKMSKKVLTERLNKEQKDKIQSADTTVDSLLSRMRETEYKNYNVIIKGDVQGSVEALKQTIGSIENEEVKVRCIHGGVGAINENDIMLASASNALILAFNVKSDFKAKVLADKYKINIQNFRIIYEAMDYVTKQINAMLTPKYREVITGHAEIRMIFKASKVGAIAGSYIQDGKLSKNQKVKVLRNGKELYSGEIASIQREKVEVKDISAGFECGIVISGYSAFAEGDIIEGITEERIN